MSIIGVNSSVDKDVVLGKKLGGFKTKEEAVTEASLNKGSEIIYQNQDQSWSVNEVSESDGKGANPLSVKDQGTISLEAGKLEKLSIKNPVLSFVEDDIEQKAINGSCQEKIDIARNLNTPPKILSVLADQPSALSLHIQVAKNPNTPPEKLKELSNRGYFDYQHFNTEKESEFHERHSFNRQLNELTVALAKNPATPSDVLVNLAKISAQMACIVATNPSYPAKQ